jgi:hypothetical protein
VGEGAAGGRVGSASSLRTTCDGPCNPSVMAPDFKLGFRLRSDQPCAVAEA